MKGIYLLLISIRKGIALEIGRLGRIKFKKGSYIYVGSAQRGIRQRVLRHLRKKKKIRWHIDCLLADSNVKIEGVFCRETAKKSDECRAARFFMKNNEFVKGFGCSDCKCASHLIFLGLKSAEY